MSAEQPKQELMPWAPRPPRMELVSHEVSQTEFTPGNSEPTPDQRHRYGPTATRRICVPTARGAMSCRGRMSLSAEMRDDLGEGFIRLEWGRNRTPDLNYPEIDPHLFLKYEKDWSLEDTTLTEIKEMAEALMHQLRPLELQTSKTDLVILLRRLKDDRNESTLGDFFENAPDDLPTDLSAVVWHPSAGTDFSPLVAFSRGYLSQKENLADLTPATLHIMTCMGCCEEDLLTLLESEEGILFEDERTLMRIANYQMLELKNHFLWSNPSRRNCNIKGRETLFRERGSDGFFAQVEILCKESGYRESVPVIYLLAENIATYRAFMSSGLFKVRHIKAVCEGLAFGGCSRSLLDFISESELGLDTLETTWLRRDASEHRFQKLSEDWQIEVGQMPRAFCGDLVRVSRKEVSHV